MNTNEPPEQNTAAHVLFWAETRLPDMLEQNKTRGTMREDTIYAPSSAIGGAIAIIRISGEMAARTGALLDRDPAAHPREMVHTKLSHNGEIIDDCMAVYFPKP